jgi:hypothetical protein
MPPGFEIVRDLPIAAAWKEGGVALVATGSGLKHNITVRPAPFSPPAAKQVTQNNCEPLGVQMANRNRAVFKESRAYIHALGLACELVMDYPTGWLSPTEILTEPRLSISTIIFVRDDYALGVFCTIIKSKGAAGTAACETVVRGVRIEPVRR